MRCYYIASAGGDMVQQADRAVYTRSQSMEQIEGSQMCGTAWISGSMRAEHGLDCAGLSWAAAGRAGRERPGVSFALQSTGGCKREDAIKEEATI